MDLEKVLAQLRVELASLDAAILSLERLHEMSGSTRRRRKKPKSRERTPEAAPPGETDE
jgi:hypothetical protein